MKKILKAYRVLLLILFVVIMAIGSFLLYRFYNFIQPVEYEKQVIRTITEPGELEVSITSSSKEPLGVILISPSGREYTQSSRDVENTEDGSTRRLKILTADLGEWKIKYRNIPRITTSVSSNFNKSNAAMLVDTKATKDEKTNKITVLINMSSKDYKYTLKAVRRSDGFSLTSSGEGGTTIKLEPYPYEGVWDFYLNTTRQKETYSTMFSYTF